MFAVQADGAEIRTVESLADGPRMHPLQDEFWEKQGLQCGYCTPGMLMRSVEIIEENPDPTLDEVREGIASNLCRCTGYQFICEAVVAAAQRMREGADSEACSERDHRRGPPRGPHAADRGHPHRPRSADAPAVRTHKSDRKWVGKSIRRVEDPKLLRGRAGYIERPRPVHRTCTPPSCTARTPTPDHLHRHDRRSGPARRARGDHRGARRSSTPTRCPTSDRWPAVAVWRCLAVDKVRYVGEGVAVVVADDRYIAEDALSLIEVEYAGLPVVVDMLEAHEGRALRCVHEGLGTNIGLERSFDFGADRARTSPRADVVVTDRLRWRRSNGQPLETVGAIADFDPSTGDMVIKANSRQLHQLHVHGGRHPEAQRPTSSTSSPYPPAAASVPSSSPPSRR